jgi:MFS transporter, MHS family, metabolite:H+ symporter
MSTDDAVLTEGDLRRAGLAAALGSALEYYDFALYNLAAAVVFGPLFFPSIDPINGLIASFGTFFLGFAVRPLGGIVFGILGDRLGRRFVLTTTILLMGTASTLMGLLPTYETAGVWAPVLLIALRLLQGFGAGAEQAGAAVLMAECAPPERRGYFAALPFMGVMLGSALAAAVYLLVIVWGGEAGRTFAWRVPFLGSVVVVAAAVWIRLRLNESPSYARLKAHGHVERKPLAALLARSRRPLLVVIGLRIAEGGGSSIYQTLAISFMVTATNLAAETGATMLLLSGCSGAVAIVLAGSLSDRLGRLRVFRGFAVCQVALALPVWWGLSLGDARLSVLLLCVALLPVWGMLGTQGALLPELFGARHRYVGVAVGREAAAMLVGGTSPLVGAALFAFAARHWGGAVAAWPLVAGYLALLSLVSVAVTFLAPETRGRDLDRLHDPTAEPTA